MRWFGVYRRLGVSMTMLVMIVLARVLVLGVRCILFILSLSNKPIGASIDAS